MHGGQQGVLGQGTTHVLNDATHYANMSRSIKAPFARFANGGYHGEYQHELEMLQPTRGHRVTLLPILPYMVVSSVTWYKV